jgi:DNA-binding Xre family transcriptional regulator
VTPRKPAVGYRWLLRSVMAEHQMFSTTELVPMLAERGVQLSREQVYRLVAKVPERLSLGTLAALCDIFSCSPADLIEVGEEKVRTPEPPGRSAPSEIRPRRARVAREK